MTTVAHRSRELPDRLGKKKMARLGVFVDGTSHNTYHPFCAFP